MELMKRFSIITLLFVTAFLQAQISDPVSWEVNAVDLGNDRYELTSIATLEKGWHIYSQFQAGAGNVPTEFRFYEATDNYELIGINEEVGTYKQFEKAFDASVYQFEDKAIFKQVVEVKQPNVNAIVVEVIYQACNDQVCLPPAPEILIFSLDPDITLDESLGNVVDDYYESDKSPLIAAAPDHSGMIEKSKTPGTGDQEVIDTIEESNENDLTTIFLLCLLAGFGALLTPCVYPMIPMTVSFFTKRSENPAVGKFQGLLYGFFILLIYVACSLPFYLFESVSPDVFNEFSTNPYLNIFFFIIFVVFAISFFGAFEITIPNALVNKVDKASNVGGIIGVFFMALTLVLVSFSCTGPVIGGVLGSVLSSDGGATALSVGLAGFGFGLGIPFALFAIFPGWLNKLPQSGGWLNTVKVFLGFLELAFAFKFLSNADLVWQAGWLPREMFIALWIAIFGSLALFLFGKIKLPHTDQSAPISVGRLLLAIISLSFTLYLIPGLWGAPLKLISGFPPPATYSEAPNGFMGQTSSASTVEVPDGAHLGVHDIIAFDDYQAGMEYAAAVNKPVLIDFTGWACVNCRKMEERVWGEPEVLNLLKDKIVLISLYVDEREKLPKDEQYTSPTTGKRIRTVGNKWSDFQIEKYQVNAQPFYALVDPQGKDLVPPVGYTPDVPTYRQWLEKGINEYKVEPVPYLSF